MQTFPKLKLRQIDLVIVVDASESMRPCFDQLKAHLQELLLPLNQANYKVRFALVAYAAAAGRQNPVYDHTFIGGGGPDMLARLYSPQVSAADFFTADPLVIARALVGLEAQGNENTPLAIDVAADLPFGPVETTRRVIAVFTDERLEDGVSGNEPIEQIPSLIKKLMARRIQLFMAAPNSSGLEMLGTLDQAEIHPVDGGDGLRSIDFKKLLAQMGKSISLSSMQMGREPDWTRALFGQDRWGAERGVDSAQRRVVLAVGESAQLDMSAPLRHMNVKLKWTASVDLDLHAFVQIQDGAGQHVYFGNLSEFGVQLDRDAGIGNSGGRNEENLTIDAPDRFRTILFATKIYSKGGCYADYDGRVSVKTSNGDEVDVPLTSRETADWCVIAKFTNDGRSATVVNLNRVCHGEPNADNF